MPVFRDRVYPSHMCATFSEDDVGKRVENEEGRAIGVVAATDGTTAYVEPEPGLTDSIKATLGWEGDADDAVPIDGSIVGEITDDAIRLTADRSAGSDSAEGGHDPVIERTEGAGERDVSPAAEEAAGENGERRDESDGESEAGRPPDGERTVTDERGHGDDR